MPAGRPKKEVDMKKMQHLAEIQCPNNVIAAACNISVDTLDDKYSEYVTKWRDAGKTKIFETIWYKAIVQRDASMLKHCAKFYLGHHDQVVLTSEEANVRKLLQKWEGSGPKINPNSIVYDCDDKDEIKENTDSNETMIGTD